jgi:hypothetical protein
VLCPNNKSNLDRWFRHIGHLPISLDIGLCAHKCLLNWSLVTDTMCICLELLLIKKKTIECSLLRLFFSFRLNLLASFWQINSYEFCELTHSTSIHLKFDEPFIKAHRSILFMLSGLPTSQFEYFFWKNVINKIGYKLLKTPTWLTPLAMVLSAHSQTFVLLFFFNPIQIVFFWA